MHQAQAPFLGFHSLARLIPGGSATKPWGMSPKRFPPVWQAPRHTFTDRNTATFICIAAFYFLKSNHVEMECFAMCKLLHMRSMGRKARFITRACTKSNCESTTGPYELQIIYDMCAKEEGGGCTVHPPSLICRGRNTATCYRNNMFNWGSMWKWNALPYK